MTGDRWVEVADGVLVRRHAELDLCTGLVLGTDHCLVVDTRGDTADGAEWAAAVREITADPWTVVLTHAHFDHSFGAAAFLPCPVWAQSGCVTALRDGLDHQLAERTSYYRKVGSTARTDAPLETKVAIPDHSVLGRVTMRIGDRKVEFHHFGPGHTDHDLVVHVPDAGVVFAGDLVENGPDGSLTSESLADDTHLDQWPAAIDGILRLRPHVVVPGHGEPVNGAFVVEQRKDLVALATLRKDVRAGRCTVDEAQTRSRLAKETVRAALAAGRH
jgi:glyoxylase-like metal-dependent hydrolase (beta-lactamase superfamily II)